MSRPLRITYPGAWYHVMNRGLERRNIFINARHRDAFLKVLFEIHSRYHIEIHAYCLMSNHYHILIRTPLGNISRAMRHLDGVYTQRFNKMTKRDGPLFRGRYKSIIVDADTYLLRLSRYIHLNPVKAKLVNSPEEYKWSSYQAYLSGQEPYWLHTKKTLSYFDDYSRSLYRDFINSGVDDELRKFYEGDVANLVLGSNEFIKNISEKYLQERHKIKEIPEHKLLKVATQNSINTIMSCVSEFYGIGIEDLLAVKKKSGNLPRAMGMHVSKVIGQYSSSNIAAMFKNISNNSVLQSCSRIEAYIRENYKIATDFEEIKHRLIHIMPFVEI